MAENQLDSQNYEVLAARLRILLPAIYQDSYDRVNPVSMGSAAIKYDAEGMIAWDEIWRSFCDLAMAGGPPHRGTLLEPGGAVEIESQTLRYDAVVHEICRGILMVTGLAAERASVPGWVRVYCTSAAMAGWLARAIIMENVSAHSNGLVLHLPVGPDFRIEKEIKNVVTAMAKTNHYWSEHMSWEQQQTVASVLHSMEVESPTIQFPLASKNSMPAMNAEFRRLIAENVREKAGLSLAHLQREGWVGFEVGSARRAIMLMRLLVASNVLARREETVLFLPINPANDPQGKELLKRLSIAYGVLTESSLQRESMGDLRTGNLPV